MSNSIQAEPATDSRLWQWTIIPARGCENRHRERSSTTRMMGVWQRNVRTRLTSSDRWHAFHPSLLGVGECLWNGQLSQSWNETIPATAPLRGQCIRKRVAKRDICAFLFMVLRIPNERGLEQSAFARKTPAGGKRVNLAPVAIFLMPFGALGARYPLPYYERSEYS